MKILHIITDLDVGGAEMMLYNLVKEHKRSGHDINVIGLAADGPIGEKIKQCGIPVTVIDMKKNSFDLRTLFRIVNLIKEIDPDVIQTWMYHADLVGQTAAIMAGNRPVVWGLHHTVDRSTIMKPLTRKIIWINARLSTFLPKKVICCSEATCKSHIEQGYAANKMIVIPNGIDLADFKVDPDAKKNKLNEFGMKPGVQLIGMMARFHPQKDHQTFIKAAQILHRTNPDVHFILAGAQLDRENQVILDWITEAGLEENIHLIGLRSDIPQLVAGFDIATLSSAYGEALPVSICEAMACGVPCVVTDVGDSRELVSNTGITVPVKDPIALADGWKLLLSLSPEERSDLGRLARERIEKVYNIVYIARRYLKVYELVQKLPDPKRN